VGYGNRHGFDEVFPAPAGAQVCVDVIDVMAGPGSSVSLGCRRV